MTDPYKTLGVRASASDEEVRTAYRRLVQLHHPDHNNGSPESARRFEEVQEAYQRIRELRASAPRRPAPEPDPAVDARLADLERQVRKAQERARQEAERAREQARRAAREATERVRGDRPDRPTDEELGYVTTDDSFGKIIADAREELSNRFSDAREHPVARRVSDLIEGLEDLASKLDDEVRRKGQR